MLSLLLWPACLLFFFHLGLFPTLEFMLGSNNDEKKEKELFGAGIILTFFIGAAFSLFMFVVNFFIDDIFNIEFGHILRLVAPLCFIFPFRLLFSFMAIGSNKISYSAWLDVLTQLLFCSVLAWFFFYSDLSLISIICISLITSSAAFIIILFLLNPSFKNFK